MVILKKEIKTVPIEVLSTCLLNPNCLTVQTASDSLENWGGFLFTSKLWPGNEIASSIVCYNA